ncbi:MULTISPECIES: histidine phosphatase family protein [unclassified Streptomyces]|uniref:SixA phosphatase family protein n=1 Tax=unclassified Streptomyces TaxID=2593676 RepID=UPI0021C88552|nr:histidine phosphatase family protein [Streptomyces sp. FIT100]UUN28721.1 histidine phosphatase family protein [Streptomyces sp. FIT100]
MREHRAATRLVLLRHAKSAWPDVADHDRPLAPRGRRDAPAAGRLLREHGYVPDLVVCSTARRARETWELAAAELGTRVPVRYDERVYGADPAELAGVLRELPVEVGTALLVGHNPGIEDLAGGLTGEDDGDALARMTEKFPTSALAVLSLPGGWAGFRPGTARLTAFVVARGKKPDK